MVLFNSIRLGFSVSLILGGVLGASFVGLCVNTAAEKRSRELPASLSTLSNCRSTDRWRRRKAWTPCEGGVPDGTADDVTVALVNSLRTLRRSSLSKDPVLFILVGEESSSTLAKRVRERASPSVFNSNALAIVPARRRDSQKALISSTFRELGVGFAVVGCRRTVDKPLSQSVTELVSDEESGRVVDVKLDVEMISLAGEPFSCEAKLCREQYMERIFDWWAKVNDIRKLGTGTPRSLPALLANPAKRPAIPRGAFR